MVRSDTGDVPANLQRPLLPRRTAVPALLVAVLAACLCGFLGQRYADATTPGRLDATIDIWLRTRLVSDRPALLLLAHGGDPAVVGALSVLLALACLALGRRRAALLPLVTVPAAGALTEYVLKPLIHRKLAHRTPLHLHRVHAAVAHPRRALPAAHDPSYSFPSGHTVGVFALATCVLLVLLGARPNGPVRNALRLLLGLLAVALAAGVAVAVVALHRHYATDAVGGAAVAAGVVLLGALVIDAVAAGRGGSRNRPSPRISSGNITKLPAGTQRST